MSFLTQPGSQPMLLVTMPIPDRQTVIAIREPGGPEVLAAEERPTPQPGPGEVLVQVAAAGINRPDAMQRAGRYPPPPGASDLPGLEIAGIVVARAPDVTRWQVGDRVCALVTGGGYAQFCVAPADQCMRVPAGLTLTEAAALPETVLTVWANVWQRAHLAPGETLLVQGGTSGIGVAAVQIARALGHDVYATAGTPEKCQALLELGVKRAIDYRREDFVDIVREATGGRGVDVVLDIVGGDYVTREQRCLAEDGRIALIAVQGGAHATVDLTRLLVKRQTLTGSTLRSRPPAFKAALARAVELHVWPLIEAGQVRAIIHATFPLHEAAAAHRLLESGTHIGKLVLIVDPRFT